MHFAGPHGLLCFTSTLYLADNFPEGLSRDELKCMLQRSLLPMPWSWKTSDQRTFMTPTWLIYGSRSGYAITFR